VGAAAKRFVAYVTSLPASPGDGQEVFFEADSANHVVWHLRWRASASKWEFVGGGPMEAYDSSSVTRNSTSFGDFSSAGPSITAPLAGDYMVEWAVTAGENSANSIEFFVGIKNASTDPADGECLHFQTSADAAGGSDVPQGYGVYRRKFTVASPSDVLKMVARSASSAVSFSVVRRVMSVVPIRVS
jgi:hypothetical protein